MIKTQELFHLRGKKAYILHEDSSQEAFFSAGDIVHCYLGCNIGNETDGKENFIRPILILNKVGNVFWCLALTSKGKESMFQYKLDNNSFVILSSLITLDKKRFIRKKSKITKEQLFDIKKAIANISLG